MGTILKRLMSERGQFSDCAVLARIDISRLMKVSKRLFLTESTSFCYHVIAFPYSGPGSIGKAATVQRIQFPTPSHSGQ